jgi:hypothetical protein
MSYNQRLKEWRNKEKRLVSGNHTVSDDVKQRDNYRKLDIIKCNIRYKNFIYPTLKKLVIRQLSLYFKFNKYVDHDIIRQMNEEILQYKILTEREIIDLVEEINIGNYMREITEYQQISLDFFKKYKKNMTRFDIHMSVLNMLKNNYSIPTNKFILDDTNCDYVYEVDYIVMASNRALDINFIHYYKNELKWGFGWQEVCKHQILSEESIEEFQDYVDWKIVSAYQNLSEQFIDKWSEKLDWHIIGLYQKLSPTFIERHSDRFDNNYLKLNWKLWSDHEKINEIRSLCSVLYDIDNRPFIYATRIVLADYRDIDKPARYCFNQIGNVYEQNWDPCEVNVSSVGFTFNEDDSMFRMRYGYINKYAKIKIKVYLEDLVLVKNTPLFRCGKFELIEMIQLNVLQYHTEYE